MATFANTLKLLRTNKGLTQNELSQALKVSRSTIGMYENGSREPDYEMLEFIADFFNVDIDYLLGRTLKTTKIIQPIENIHQSSTPDIIKYYNQLNDTGKAEATERVKELTYIPKYSEPVLMAAHNDNADDAEEQEKIYKDLEMLKNFRG